MGVTYSDCDLLALGSCAGIVYKPGMAKRAAKPILFDWKLSAAMFECTP